MADPLLRWARERFDGPDTWVLLPELASENRIPDLVAARVDLDALEQRVAHGALRGLGSTELLAVRLLRRDRTLSLEGLTRRMPISEERARRVLRGLVSDGIVHEPRRGQYLRTASYAPVVTRFVGPFETEIIEEGDGTEARALLSARS